MRAIATHLRERLAIYLPLALLIAAVLAAAMHWVKPLPPDRLVFAAGPTGGVYDAVAHRYRERLAREGIAVEILTTRGTVENLALLRGEARRADAALIQGGVGAGAPTEGLEALGSVFYEPVFVFHQRKLELQRLSQLAGRRVAIGAEGSGTRALALQLLARNGITEANATLLAIGTAEATRGLVSGEIDAGFFVIAHPLPSLAPLFRTPAIELFAFERADAYRMSFPFVSKVTLPSGSIDLADDIPSRDVTLIAPAAALVVREDLHPALKNLLVRIAREIHGGQQLFSASGRFPSLDHLDHELNSYARRYIESGPSFFARFLPFWVAVWGERLLILLLPLIGILLPIARITPPLFRWQTERRIYRWYRHLGRLEQEARNAPADDASRKIRAQLDDLQARVRGVRVPLSYAKQLYDLREHIDFVRSLLDGRSAR
jgi:TRAP transporter TAXI family solute receptor